MFYFHQLYIPLDIEIYIIYNIKRMLSLFYNIHIFHLYILLHIVYLRNMVLFHFVYHYNFLYIYSYHCHQCTSNLLNMFLYIYCYFYFLMCNLLHIQYMMLGNFHIFYMSYHNLLMCYNWNYQCRYLLVSLLYNNHFYINHYLLYIEYIFINVSFNQKLNILMIK